MFALLVEHKILYKFNHFILLTAKREHKELKTLNRMYENASDLYVVYNTIYKLYCLLKYYNYQETLNKYPRYKRYLIFARAKLSIIKMKKLNQQENCSPETLFKSGVRVFLAMLQNQKQYYQFSIYAIHKVNRIQQLMQLSSLPPTSSPTYLNLVNAL